MTAAKETLDRLLFSKHKVKYGSLDEDCLESPCERVYFEENEQEDRIKAMKLAFFAAHGRHCRRTFKKSHRCREARKTKRSESGICVNGHHIEEETTSQNSIRNLHQHLLQCYLQYIIGKGWEQKAYYVSDVPDEYVKQFWAEKKKPYKKIICECNGLCFINGKRVE